MARQRKQYPQYDKVPDNVLADALYNKYYSSIPKEEFLGKLGLGASEPTPAPATQAPEEGSNFLRQVADVPLQFGKGAATGVRMIAETFGANSGVSQALTGVED